MSQHVSELEEQMIALIPLELILHQYANSTDHLGGARYEGVRWHLLRQGMVEHRAKDHALADLCIGVVTTYVRPSLTPRTVDELEQPFLELRDSYSLENRFAIWGIKAHTVSFHFLGLDLPPLEEKARWRLRSETKAWLKAAPFYDLAALGEEAACTPEGKESLARIQAGYEKIRDHRLRMNALHGRTE
ncbi:hypothetical protein HNP46_006333 [Pseudomonas nitritireducens]|uniref:Uncharacterized protein n=1 Tax=Pseudomonas nitroreducens TaxID=46680 RepID=A0A7W7KRV1_PSENT|nr:hypothetical protein [Pseudomonas nitritireducens]MBB4867420.1 hypothetical protein [Pseudomonas nitritireducens]